MGEQFRRRWERIVRLDKQKNRNTCYCDTKREKESSCQKKNKKERNFEVMEGRLKTFKCSLALLISK